MRAARLIPKVLDIGPFHGGRLARRAGAVRSAMCQIGQAPPKSSLGTRWAEWPHPPGRAIFTTIDIVVGRTMRIAAESNTVDVAPDPVQRIAAVSSHENCAVSFEGKSMHGVVA